MKRFLYGFIGLLVLVMVGCGKTESEPTPQSEISGQQESVPVDPQAQEVDSSAGDIGQAPQPASQAKPAVAKPTPKPAAVSAGAEAAPRTPNVPVSKAADSRSASPSPPATPPAPQYVVIPAGTPLAVRLLDPLDTGINEMGDSFRALLDSDVLVDGVVVAPRGAVLQGRLTQVVRSGRVEGRAQLSLHLTEMKNEDRVVPITTDVLSYTAESTKKEDAKKVGIGAGIGAAIGAIAGGGKGAAIGAAVGGGAGGAAVVATRGKELKFPVEHQFRFRLQEDLQVQMR